MCILANSSLFFRLCLIITFLFFQFPTAPSLSVNSQQQLNRQQRVQFDAFKQPDSSFLQVRAPIINILDALLASELT
jgi:hypothetical protein